MGSEKTKSASILPVEVVNSTNQHSPHTPMPELFGSDAYAPKEIALKVETVGVAKAHMATLPLVMLGLLAGAFIGLGGLFFVIVKSDASLSLSLIHI